MKNDSHLNTITGQIIGAAIEVHKILGPGLLEPAYRDSLSKELLIRRIPHFKELRLPVEYKGLELNRTYVLGLLVNDSVVVEIKAVEALHPIHTAQILTYLRLGGWKVGLLVNFNVEVLRKGVRRIVRDFRE